MSSARCMNSSLFVVAGILLAVTAPVGAQVCSPVPGAIGCDAAACPDSTLPCVPTVVALDAATGALVAVECACMGSTDCYLDLTAGALTCAGACAVTGSGECRLVGSDTNGDGVEDHFRCGCPSYCHATDPAMCGSGEFCKDSSGSCGTASQPGVCTPMPGGCPDVWDPVCGCDGATYGNECEADAAGVSIMYAAECMILCHALPDRSGCTVSGCSDVPEIMCTPTVLRMDMATGAIGVMICECLDFNTCHVEFGNATPFPVGSCPDGEACEVIGVDTNGDGIDDEFHAACFPAQHEGVCCLDIDDGPISYDTCITMMPADCLAQGGLFHGVNVLCDEVQACCFMAGGVPMCVEMNPFCCEDSGGVPQGAGSTCVDAAGQLACPKVCGGFVWTPCDDGEYCRFNMGECCCDQQGLCFPIPSACPEYLDPVCGCDGVTYDNECFAAMAGVSIDHPGPCGRVCGGMLGMPSCPSDEFCKFPPGACEDPAVLGICTVIPQDCPDVWDPVCGCDGLTYGNECDADAAKVSMQYPDVCRCEPAPNGLGCNHAPCSVIPEVSCMASGLQLDPLTGMIRTVACECLDFNECHLKVVNGKIVPEGFCPNGVPCGVVGEDTNGDGVDDLFRATCSPVGACCLDDPAGITSCIEATPEVCADHGGMYLGDGTACPPPGVPCGMPPIGPCCFDLGGSPLPVPICEMTTQHDCDAFGGFFDGEGATCESVAQACCFPWHWCLEVGPNCCLGFGGEPQGPGSTCVSPDGVEACPRVCGGIAGLPCNDGEYCAYEPGTCDIADRQGVCEWIPGACITLWDPVCGCDGVTYSNDCVAAVAGMSIDYGGECNRGACCMLDGSCLALPEDICLATGGTHLGVGIPCPPDGTCGPTPTGACCIPVPGSPHPMCHELTVMQCLSEGGEYLGDGTTCPSDPSVPCGSAIGACCLPNAAGLPECMMTTPEVCLDQGGAHLGAGTECTPDSCGLPMGACCLPDGRCLDLPEDLCLATGGMHLGVGTVCTPDSCGALIGACCLPMGLCEEMPYEACLAEQGAWEGVGTICPPDLVCDPRHGACCLDPVTGAVSCFVGTEGACMNAGGAYQGHYTECPTDPTIPCGAPIGACCLPTATNPLATCHETTVIACLGDGGTYLGDGTVCPADPAIPCDSVCHVFCRPGEDCFTGCGTLVQGVECVLFEADSGGLYILDNLAGFVVGDRVEVTGCVNPSCYSTCMQGNGCIHHNTIDSCGDRVCGGIAGLPCDSGEFCLFPEGTCHYADHMGVCRPIPDDCPSISHQVCGCDGVTYDNECFAHAASQSLNHHGGCEGAYCWSNEMCGDQLYCFFHVCEVESGVCLPRPQGCPDVWDPVCGCDGVTYGNECEAAAAGMSVAFSGSCISECRPTADGLGCEPNACSPIPEDTCLSTAVRMGAGSGIHVAACDCLSPHLCHIELVFGGPMQAVGECPDGGDCSLVGHDTDGDGIDDYFTAECERVCGGIAGLPCNDGEFCHFPDGTCNVVDRMGVCEPMPTGCPDVWDPVCGCDGETYGNECEAIMAGMSVDHPGPCERICGGFAGNTCGDDEFCKFPDGICNDTVDHTGICTPVPTDCPDYYLPVCGCDGRTYGNECDADMARVSVRHHGPCEQVCGGIAGLPCDPGAFCHYPEGTCHIADRMGVCEPIPAGCPDVWDPVCGCDGVTYPNECVAYVAGQSIDHWGACEGGECAATRALLSPSLSYCPSVPTRVRIALTPPNSTAAIGVEDVPPDGWVVENISHGGTYDHVNGKVKWGPMFPPFPVAVHYDVIPVSDTAGVACFSGTISVDGINQVICGDECLDAHCRPYHEVDMPQPACGSCPVGDCTTCPGHSCKDGRITLCEVIGYACAWMVGCNDDLAGMARAAYLWRHGECYCWNETEANWYPSSCPPPASGICTTAQGQVGGISSGEATLSVDRRPDSKLNARSLRGRRLSVGLREVEVPVSVIAPVGATVMALEVEVPHGLKVVDISDSGSWDDVNRKIKWGPFYSNLSRTLTFKARNAAPDKAESAVPVPSRDRQMNRLRGTVSFDGVNQPLAIR